MKLSPIAAGFGAGLAAMLLLAPFVGTGLGRLAAARADHARVTALAAATPPKRPIVAPGLGTSTDMVLLATRLRGRAHDSGVLVEKFAIEHGEGTRILIRIAVSGSENAVIAFADTIERGTPLLRLRSWRLEPVAGGGLRLTGEVLGTVR